MWLQASCKLAFEILTPTPFILMLRARCSSQQWIAREAYDVTPMTPVDEFTDSYGNLCQRLIAPTGEFTIHTQIDVLTKDSLDRSTGAPFIEIRNLPDSVLNFLLPSRYCESERFGTMANEITANMQPGFDQVEAIELWLRRNIAYIPGSSDFPISATEVNARGSGVCRDLSHLGIALCRSISIPARLVVGYLHELEPMDMHAWFEAYVGDRWYRFDATQTTAKLGYIVVGYGRDAADVAVFNQFGPLAVPTQDQVQVKQIDPPAAL